MAEKLGIDAKVVLLDIEGTVCPISFVKDVLFPYALSALPSVLATQWDSPSFIPYRDAFPAEHRSSPEKLKAHVEDLMAQDVKIAYLKSLQGYLWLTGYESGELSCPLFPDVYPSLKNWTSREPPLTIIIYSSGSVAAQKLLFKYTNVEPHSEADLTPLITDYFDTVNAGLKQESQSYRKIAGVWGGLAGVEEWLFLSDNVREVEAAREAGMQAVVVVREGNAPLSEEDKERFELVENFESILIKGT